VYKQRADTETVNALQFSEQRFQAIWDAAADAMALSDADGVVLAANPAYYELYGYSPEQVIGHNFAIIFPVDQRASAIAQYKEIFRLRPVLPIYESTIHTADGSERIVETRATFVTLGIRQTALLSVIRDITARKQLEEERDQLLEREQAARIEAETALRIRNQFLTIAAHELKTPLTALSGHTEVVRRRIGREHALSERDQKALHIIDAQAKRLHMLIDSLLDISRIQGGKFSIERKPLNLYDLVRELIEELEPVLERHTLHLESQISPLVINGDAGRLAQVVQNLLQNALKYSPAGGPVQIRLYQKEGQACLEVRDQGIGIPEAAQAHLFQQFYRAEHAGVQQIPGMGIGLYVVNEIVALHDGNISLSSREGEGSAFTVCLPLYAADQTSYSGGQMD
jgi:PAS domain S-box-containing protein